MFIYSELPFVVTQKSQRREAGGGKMGVKCNPLFVIARFSTSHLSPIYRSQDNNNLICRVSIFHLLYRRAKNPLFGRIKKYIFVLNMMSYFSAN